MVKTEREVTPINPGYYRQDCDVCSGDGVVLCPVCEDPDGTGCVQCGGDGMIGCEACDTSGKKTECIDAMWVYFHDWVEENEPAAFGAEQRMLAKMMFLGFCLGNAFKYRYRKGHKGLSDEDEAKAQWYSQMARHKRNPEVEPDPRAKP
jgi:hypothetical protein